MDGTLETHLQHIHARVVCDDCGPAIDFALAAASETGGQVTRLRDWLQARRPEEFDLSTDGTVVTGILTLLDREGREWPSENDCRSIEVALRLHAKQLGKEARKLRDLGHPALGTNLEVEGDRIIEQLVAQFSSQIGLPLEPAGAGKADYPPQLFDGPSDGGPQP